MQTHSGCDISPQSIPAPRCAFQHAAQNVFISLPSAGDHFKPIRSDLERDCSELLKLLRGKKNSYFGHTRFFPLPLAICF